MYSWTACQANFRWICIYQVFEDKAQRSWPKIFLGSTQKVTEAVESSSFTINVVGSHHFDRTT